MQFQHGFRAAEIAGALTGHPATTPGVDVVFPPKRDSYALRSPALGGVENLALPSVPVLRAGWRSERPVVARA